MRNPVLRRAPRLALGGLLALGCLGLPNGSAPRAAPAPAPAPSNASWFVRLKVDDYASRWKFDGTLLGQQPGAAVDWDPQDLPAMPPFSPPYLFLTFPRPTWGQKAGDYTSDFRPAAVLTRGDWPFELRASKIGSTVHLRRDGDAAILRRSLLIDVDSGAQIKGDDPRWSGNGLSVNVDKNVKKYIWRYLGP